MKSTLTLTVLCLLVYIGRADTYLVRQDAQASEMSDLKAYLVNNFTPQSLGTIHEGSYETSASIPSVTTNDLVVFTRSCDSGAYDDEGGAEIDAWNSLPAPMMMLNSFMVRADSDQLGWLSGSVVTSVSTSNDESVVLVPGDPLFAGLTLSPSNTVNLYDVDGNEGFGEGVTGSGGEMLVKDVTTNVLVARFAAGSPIETVVAGGAVSNHGGARIYFSMDSGTDSSITDLTATGLTVFGRALEELGLVRMLPFSPSAGAPINGVTPSGIASYEQFAATYGLAGSSADWWVDPDSDNVINLHEYVWFMNPTNADAAPLELSESTPLDATGTPAYEMDALGANFNYATVLRNDDPYLVCTLSMVTNLTAGGTVPVELPAREHIGPSSEVARMKSAASYPAAYANLTITRQPTGSVYHIATQTDFDTYKNATFAPGDQILFQRGAIFNGMFAPQGSGLPGRPIVIASYGSGPMPIINGLGAPNTAAILLHNVEQWEVHNLEATNTDGSDTNQGKLFGILVLLDTTAKSVLNHYHIRDCYVHDVNGTTLDPNAKERGGIHVRAVNDESNPPFRLNDVLIVGNSVDSVGGVGIATASDYVNVDGGSVAQLWTDVYVAHNFVNDTDRNNMIIRSCKDGVVEYNVFANSSRANTGNSFFNFNTDGIIVQNNEAYGNVGGGGSDRGGFDADYSATNTTYQYNYSHDNLWFCSIMKQWNKDVKIRYNISQNELEGFYFYGFESATAVEDVLIHNNVHFTRADIAGVQFIAENRTPRNTSFYNNIFYFEGGGSWNANVSNGVNVAFSHNVYYNLPEPDWTTDAHAITNNPLLVAPGTGGHNIDMSDPNRLSGYRLQAGSPCIGAGRSISGVDRDFWGNPVPTGGGADIGAQERQP